MFSDVQSTHKQHGKRIYILVECMLALWRIAPVARIVLNMQFVQGAHTIRTLYIAYIIQCGHAQNKTSTTTKHRDTPTRRLVPVSTQVIMASLLFEITCVRCEPVRSALDMLIACVVFILI